MKDHRMGDRLSQLARVLDMVDQYQEVGVLQLADAVQLCDERYFMEEVTRWEGDTLVRVGWEMLRASANGQSKVGVHESLFPTLRAGFIWLGREMLKTPPRERHGMFPYFDALKGWVFNDQHGVQGRRPNKAKYAARDSRDEEEVHAPRGPSPQRAGDAPRHLGAIGELLQRGARDRSSSLSAVAGTARTDGATRDSRLIG